MFVIPAVNARPFVSRIYILKIQCPLISLLTSGLVTRQRLDSESTTADSKMS